MFILLVVLNSYSIITGVTCLLCLVFLFFETAFGICLGCLVYGWIYKDKGLYCAGESCEVKAKQPIQKISPVQYLIVLGSIVYVLMPSFFSTINFV
jgi:hypothetical protein